MKFFTFLTKNLNDFCPSNLIAIQRHPVKADPNNATNVEAISELGSGNKKSNTTPINGAAKIVEVRGFFPEACEELSSKIPLALDSPHL
jgi:hypothetical protein